MGSNFVRPIEPIILWSFGTTLVGLLYLGGDKSEKVCTGYEVLPTKGLNLLKIVSAITIIMEIKQRETK